jgi:membrane glycosyltransferase
VLAVSFGDLAAAQVAALRGVYWLYLMMYLAPKLAGYLHTAWSGHRRSRYGGLLRFVLGAVCEIVFSFLQSSITSFHTALFMLSLGMGRSIRWSGQSRDASSVSWRQAWAAFWPQTIFGAAVNVGLLLANPVVLVYALPFTLGTLIAVPFAVVTASRAFGAWSAGVGLCDVPEDRTPPPEVAALRIGALDEPVF